MTDVICVGDIHVMDKAPRNATESYTDDIIDILMWVADYAAENGIKYVVWAGDVFHFKQPSKTSHALVLRMIGVVRYHRKKGIDLMIVTGNHDISNDVLATIHEKQPLGVLYKAGARELVGWHPKAPIFGVPWRHDWTTSESSAWDAFKGWRQNNGLIIGEEDLVDPIDISGALAVTHCPIYPPAEAENIQWNLVPTMGPTGISAAMQNMGSLYFGHIHEDHGVFEVEGVTYANMGAISRGSMTEYNLERTIKIAVWNDETGFREVVVPQKPASEVLRIEKATEEKVERLSLDRFLNEVGQSSLDISSTASVVQYIQSRNDVPDRVRAKAIEILEEVS